MLCWLRKGGDVDNVRYGVIPVQQGKMMNGRRGEENGLPRQRTTRGGGYDSRKGMSGSGGARKKGKTADGEGEDGDEDGTEASNKGTRARQREGRVWLV